MKTRATATILLVSLFVHSTAFGFGRDADGSRMQARPHTLGSTADDQLSPPNDAVDWRYVRLSDPTEVTFSVDGSPSSAALKFTLTDARGKALVRESSTNGSLSVKRQLDPGLYYVSVSATASVSYKISIR